MSSPIRHPRRIRYVRPVSPGGPAGRRIGPQYAFEAVRLNDPHMPPIAFSCLVCGALLLERDLRRHAAFHDREPAG